MTLVELMVATFVLSIVLLVFTSTLSSVQRAVVRQDNLSRTNDQMRLAIEQIDREIRSGNVLYDPAGEDPAYYQLRIYTQSNAPTRGTFSCVLWQIDDDGNLKTRRWPPSDPDSATPWRVVAAGVVSRTLGEPAFLLDPEPLRSSRTLVIDLAVNSNYDDYPSQTVRLQASLTGRNTSTGFPATVCSTTPS